MKTIAILSSIILLVSCQEERLILDNGLTKGAHKTSEVLLSIEIDSNGIQLEDTMLIKDKYFNNLDKIIKWKQLTYYDDVSTEIDFAYNEFNKVKKESIYMSEDSIKFDILYYFQDSMVKYSTSEFNREDYKFFQKSNYSYTNNRNLEKIVTNSTYILPETSDSILKKEIEFYSKGEQLIKKEFYNYSNPQEDEYHIYKYKNKNLASRKEFNYNDSLLSKVEYKYEFDEYSNWIERKSIENDSISYRIIRNIDYRDK